MHARLVSLVRVAVLALKTNESPQLLDLTLASLSFNLNLYLSSTLSLSLFVSQSVTVTVYYQCLSYTCALNTATLDFVSR